MTFYDATWTGKIEVGGWSFDALKEQVAIFAKRVANAKTFAELPCQWAGAAGFGEGTNHVFVACKWSSPVEARIAQLREEADKLEAEAAKATSL